MRRCALYGDCRERGAAAVEFALVLPILLLCVLGLIEFARMIWTQTTLDYAVQAAARCYALGRGVAGATCQTAAQTQQYANTMTPGLSLPANTFIVTIEACDGMGGPVQGAKVAVSGLPFDFLVPALLPYSQTLNASACFPA